VTRKLRRVPKDKKTGIPKKYLSGSKNRSAKAAEIKRTAEAYRKGEYIDIKAVQKSRVAQNVTTKKKKKTTKRSRKKSS
jgi:predicted transcriptional regulator